MTRFADCIEALDVLGAEVVGHCCVVVADVCDVHVVVGDERAGLLELGREEVRDLLVLHCSDALRDDGELAEEGAECLHDSCFLLH